MKWASLLLFLLTLPLVFNAPPLEILRLKTFDALVETPEPTGYFTILNIDEEFIDQQGGYPLPRQTLADIHLKLLQQGALGVGWTILFPHPDRLGGDALASPAMRKISNKFFYSLGLVSSRLKITFYFKLYTTL